MGVKNHPRVWSTPSAMKSAGEKLAGVECVLVLERIVDLGVWHRA